jgi:hypothetical protein
MFFLRFSYPSGPLRVKPHTLFADLRVDELNCQGSEDNAGKIAQFQLGDFAFKRVPRVHCIPYLRGGQAFV